MITPKSFTQKQYGLMYDLKRISCCRAVYLVERCRTFHPGNWWTSHPINNSYRWLWRESECWNYRSQFIPFFLSIGPQWLLMPMCVCQPECGSPAKLQFAVRRNQGRGGDLFFFTFTIKNCRSKWLSISVLLFYFWRILVVHNPYVSYLVYFKICLKPQQCPFGCEVANYLV